MARFRFSLLVAGIALLLCPANVHAFTPRARHVKVLLWHVQSNDGPRVRSDASEHGALDIMDVTQLVHEAEAEIVTDYESATLAYVPESALAALRTRAAEGNIEIQVRDDFDLIHLPDGVIDTRRGFSASLPGRRMSPPHRDGENGVYLIQLAGPAMPDWMKEVDSLGLKLIQYLPYNAFIAAGAPAEARRAAQLHYVQYVDVMHASVKPQRVNRQRGVVTEISIQLANVPGVAGAIEELSAWSQSPVRTSAFGASEVQLFGSFDGGVIDVLVEHPLVFGLAATPAARFSDERVAMSLTNNVSNGFPTNPKGYSAWLTGTCWFCRELVSDGFFAAIADSGMNGGNGGTQWDDLPSTRIRYGSNLDSQSQSDTILKDTTGHGTMVAGVVAGDRPSGTTSDTGGFWLGTGVAPSGGVFITKINPGVPNASYRTSIFDSATDARITANPVVYIQNHSYNQYTEPNDTNGCQQNIGRYDGKYSLLSRDFDYAVRDANNTGTAQPITLTVSSGNTNQGNTGTESCGSNYRLALPPGTAKNVISVGAAENVRTDTFAWNCQGVFSAQSYDNVASITRRGTNNPDWFKPDLIAPGGNIGSLLSSELSAHPFCNISGVSSPYTAGSGTSFSAPVAAGAALIASRVYAEYLNPNCGATDSCAPGAASPAMLKAMLIMSARSMRGGIDKVSDTQATIEKWPNAVQGFGRIHLEDLLNPDPARVHLDESDSRVINSGGSWSQTFQVHDTSKPVKVVLVWSDPPALQSETDPLVTTTTPLVNDLNLSAQFGSPCTSRRVGNRTEVDTTLTTPDKEVSTSYSCTGGTFDSANNVEVIRFKGSDASQFTVVVNGVSGVSSQKFALVAYNAYIASDPPPATPAGLAATATSTTQVSLTWSGASGATSYEVQRKSANGVYTTIATPTTTSLTDSGLAASAAYVYRVRARNGVGVSAYGTPALATTVSFTDTLVPGTTLIKAVHFNELRSAINLGRALGGLSNYSFAETLVAGTTPIRASHLNELRSALDGALNALGIALVTYTDSTISVGVTPVKAVHVTELRNSVQ